MNFKQYKMVLKLISKSYGNMFMRSDSEERTNRLKELSECRKAFEKSHEHTLDELPESLEEFKDFGDKFSAEEWINEGLRDHMFIPSDGCGYWATNKGYSYEHAGLWGRKPEWATHVIWYNA